MEPSSSTADVLALSREPARLSALRDLIGSSAPMEDLRARVLRFARSMAPVVVTGESGSGKELVARALHACSPRQGHSFVAANAATFGGELLGSELFGHARGAFTGAVGPHRGLFEQANEGTLFLDEIAELSLPAQAALLRVLETGEVRAVGAERVTRVQVRLVVATHRDLHTMVKAGTFRLDLFYRLHVLTLRVPPLRERVDDVLPLTLHLLERLAPEVGRRTLTLQAHQALALPSWPGNVRQLVNVLRRAAALTSTSELDLGTVLTALAEEPDCEPAPESIRCPTPALILQTLERCGGNKSKAARLLGIPRSTLRDTLFRYGIDATR